MRSVRLQLHPHQSVGGGLLVPVCLQRNSSVSSLPSPTTPTESDEMLTVPHNVVGNLRLGEVLGQRSWGEEKQAEDGAGGEHVCG